MFDVVEAVGYFACLSEVVLDGKDGDALVLMEGIEFLVDVALAGQVDGSSRMRRSGLPMSALAISTF